MNTVAPPSSKTAPVLPRVKQPQRKGKKNWRRNVDITLEEDTLQELREQERLGLGNIQNQADQILFTTDTKADEQVRKREFDNRRLRIDDILTAHSGIPALTSRSKNLNEKCQDKSKLSKNELARIKKQVVTNERRKAQPPKKKQGTDFSIWEAPNQDQVPETDEFMRAPPTMNVPSTIRKAPKAKQVVAAVQVPAPGASYHPQYEEHQSLLREAIAVEERKLMELNAIHEKLNPKPSEIEGEVQILQANDDSAASDEEEAESFTLPATRRLTRTERNKLKRKKEEQVRIDLKRQKREILDKLCQLEALNASCEEKETLRSKAAEERRKRREVKEARPKRLSKFHQVPLPICVHLTEEIAGSLRATKPEGNLIKERLDSLQKRNIIEARLPAKLKRKYPLKTFEKQDFKEFE